MNTERKSGIELLKIIGIILVIINHVVQTLQTDWTSTIGINDYFIDLSHTSIEPLKLILIILRYTGPLGNMIFFVCSAWFLIDKNKTNYKRLLSMFIDVFVISICILIPMIFYIGIDCMDSKIILKCLLPTINSNNWYVTNYLIFCLIVPFLNIIIRNITKETHKILAFLFFSIFMVICFFLSLPFENDLLSWVAIYIVLSYIKLYKPEISNNKRFNIKLIIIGFIGMLVLIIGINILGEFNDFVSTGPTYFWDNGNFLNFFIVLGLLNLMMDLKFTSKFINYISSLSLFIYLIHENILVRMYIRPLIWHFIYINLGYDLIFLWISIYVLILFIISALLSALYKKTIHQLIVKISDSICGLVNKIYSSISE